MENKWLDQLLGYMLKLVLILLASWAKGVLHEVVRTRYPKMKCSARESPNEITS